MPVKEIAELVDKTNEGILNQIRADSSLDYQYRIPEATQASIRDVINNLQNNRPSYNEFVDALVNRIGLTIGKGMIWENPMSMFKIGLLQHGDTIEEYAVGLLKAHTYDHDREAGEKAIFHTELPQVKAIFHKRNRQEYYKVTINENALFAAFLTPGGISDFVTKLMQAPTTSDQWDEFLQMCNLIGIYEANNGFYKVQVPDVRAITSDAVASKAAVRAIRGMAKTLTFPSTKYNAARMPTFANPDELILLATPEFQAAVDVEALAAAFNPDKLSTPTIITIPKEQWGIKGAQAMLTTKDFWVVADTRIQTEQARNPVKMHTNYFLHHWSILSVSTFVPAVLFTTEPGTEEVEVSTPVTSVKAITVTDRENETVTDVKRGEIYNVDSEALTTPEGGENKGVRWSLAGATAPRTRVTQNGVLHVDGTEGATSLTLTATATWLNPEGLTLPGEKATASVTVSGPAATEWPVKASGEPAALMMSRQAEDETGESGPYDNMTKAQLAEVLSERGLATTGTNAEMTTRLVENDAENATEGVPAE